MDRLDPATERYLRTALRAAHAKGVRAGRAEFVASMFQGLNGDGERVLTKALAGLIAKGFNESDHPRDDHGRFVSGADLSAAKTDPAKAKELRERVTDPEQRAKLERHLGGTEAADAAPAEGAAKEAPAAGAVAPEYGPGESGRHEIRNIDQVAESAAGGTRVLSGDEADRFAAESGIDRVPEAAAQAVRTLKASSALNKYNRNPDSFGPRPDLDKVNAALDQAIAAAPPLPEAVSVFRGVDGVPALAALKPGDEFADPAHGSTSLDRDYAKTALGGDFADNVMLQVRLPAGSRGLYAGGAHPDYAHERELILPRGSRFRVSEVRDLGKGKYVVADLLPAAGADKPPDVVEGRRRVREGLTPEEVAAHVEAADLDPTQFTPDDLYALAKQAPAETGAKRRVLAELANHESSVAKKLEAGGSVHPEVVAHHPHLQKPAGRSELPNAEPAPSPAPPAAPAPAAKRTRRKKES